MKKDDGYIVVETVGTFVPFVLLVISILSLVNIITLQARMHYALTQAAGTLSMYCYVLEATGAAGSLAAMDSRADAFAGTMEEVLGGISMLSGGSPADIGNMADNGGIYDFAQLSAGNPSEMMKNMANYGLNHLRNAASSALAEPLVKRYLASGNASADEYFSKMRIAGFEIAQCAIADRNGNVKLTAEYEVEYTFGALKLPFTPTLRISQTVQTKAWLGGSGEGYR